MKCKKHPKYQAKRPPRVDCPECKEMYELACLKRENIKNDKWRN